MSDPIPTSTASSKHVVSRYYNNCTYDSKILTQLDFHLSVEMLSKFLGEKKNL